ncbi:MAG: hypothetical protein PHS79_04395 [Patescibacteria group bacterium]|nr:hypothetical protein [Patescibacteria group bacterium]
MKHRTYGREFLLLLEIDVLKAYTKYTLSKDGRWICIRSILAIIQILFFWVGYQNHPFYWFSVFASFLLIPVEFSSWNSSYLRTIYHKRRVEAAVRRSETAVQALNKKLPTEKYRVPANVSDAVRLRVRLRERTLPEYLEHEAAIIVQAHDEMAEAEQALAELEAAKTKASTQTT